MPESRITRRRPLAVTCVIKAPAELAALVKSETEYWAEDRPEAAGITSD
jgi:hypothetical protein